MITMRDKAIIKFAETHGSITINQCANIFFNNNKEKYDQARKRLQVLHKEGLLKRYRKEPKSQAVYFIDRKLKTHDLKLIDVYSEFKSLDNIDITYYEKEKKLNFNDFEEFRRLLDIPRNTTYIVDAVITLNSKEFIKRAVIEIDYTHYTNDEKIKNIINFLEASNDREYIFLIVSFSAENLKVTKVGKYSKLVTVPWSLDGLQEFIINELNPYIEVN